MKAFDPVMAVKPQFIKWPDKNQLTDNNVVETETAEEREAFERLHRAQMIKRMTAVARLALTTTPEGICAQLFDAGCCFDDAVNRI
ncbi:hypothetical protein [Shewanella glacialipiscicola]|uniref:hypothetical protein n=1 Tax=Shewanella glacialipiscicola TaxID=614069 RepID=UPI003D78BC61